MERVVHIAKSFEEADEYDVMQQITMNVEQRQTAAKRLKEHYYGLNNKDVRESHKNDQ